MPPKNGNKRHFANPRLMAVLLLSFSSGLPLALTASTLQAWYTVAGVSLLTIGALTLVGQPYVYKFLWAPLMDRYKLFGLGRRRGWILLMQLLLVIGLITMAFLNPKTHAWVLAGVALAVAFCSASQDIAFDAYRTDVLHVSERGLGAAFNTFGYRVAMIVSGAIALILAAEIGWRWTYIIMAALLVSEIGITFWAPMPERIAQPPQTIAKAVIEPLHEFFKRDNAIALLVFIVIYKLTDAFALSLNTPFLIRGIGFNLLEIGTIYKVVSLISTLIGSLAGGLLMRRMGLFRSLLYFGLLQAASNLAYVALALVGKSYILMVGAVFTEYFCGGLSAVAFVAFLMSLCDRRYSATHYALFSALAAAGRVFAGPEAAMMVNHIGWALFYFVTFLIGIPALLLLWWLRSRVDFSTEKII